MFEFRIIETADGNQIIDMNLKTPYSTLTPVQMVEYMEVDTFDWSDRQAEMFWDKYFIKYLTESPARAFASAVSSLLSLSNTGSDKDPFK